MFGSGGLSIDGKAGETSSPLEGWISRGVKFWLSASHAHPLPVPCSNRILVSD